MAMPNSPARCMRRQECRQRNIFSRDNPKVRAVAAEKSASTAFLPILRVC